jgi:hypothetical protein
MALILLSTPPTSLPLYDGYGFKGRLPAIVEKSTFVRQKCEPAAYFHFIWVMDGRLTLFTSEMLICRDLIAKHSNQSGRNSDQVVCRSNL